MKDTEAGNFVGDAYSENDIKRGILRILEQRGKFSDWGGERNDFIANPIVCGRRRAAAFALKGPAQRGKLTLSKMGQNGDQIQRLFSSHSSDVFIVQYNRQIDETVLEQMEICAIAASHRNRKRIYYGVFDGQDTDRLIRAYSEHFTSSRR